jgi:O-antigen biosynthesis protein
MLTDREAEHIPGCNMAFYKWALDEIGLFDPLFRKAGDDVDICWRLQQHGYKIGFSPAGFVWHYRRSTVRDYLKQQHGYGEAEALLVHRHPEYFNWFGGSQWQGRIYSPAKFGVLTHPPIIYHGMFGSGFFQTLYSAQPAATLMLLTSLEYHVLVTLPLLVLGIVFRFLLPLTITSVLASLAICGAAAAQADLPKRSNRFWSRPLVALLFFLQPMVRGWARYQGRLTVRRRPLAEHETLDSLSLKKAGQEFAQLQYWSEQGVERYDFLAAVLERLDHKNWQNKADAGWNNFDVEIFGSRWSRLRLITAAEILGHRKQLLRCRLETDWTFFAHIVFWAMTGIELVIIGFFAQSFPWLWLMLLSLPAYVAWLGKEQKDLQRLIAVFLNQVAEEMKLVPIRQQKPVTAVATSNAKAVDKATPIKVGSVH